MTTVPIDTAKTEKKSKKEKRAKEAEVTAPAAAAAVDTEKVVAESITETKEERRARKEAKRAAKAAKAAAAPITTDNVVISSTDAEAEAGPSRLPISTEPVPVDSSADIPIETPEEKLLKEEKKKLKLQKREKKRKAEQEVEAERLQVIADDLTTEESERKRRKKEKKQRRESGLPDLEENISTAPKEDVSVDVEVKGDKGEEKKESKKDKKRKGEAQQGAWSPSIPADNVQPPLHQTTTDGKPAGASETTGEEASLPAEGVYADPNLSDTAKKAIAYCQQYASSHGPEASTDSTWKFNKAKQLWLVRHLWDDAEVTDEYIDVIVAYLKTVQGGGRAGLIDAAKKQRDAVLPITESTAEPATPEEAAAPAAQTADEKDEKKPETEIKEVKAEEVAKQEEIKRKFEVAKSRAVKLLKAMGAR